MALICQSLALTVKAEPWQTAVSRFLDGLSDEDKTLFSETSGKLSLEQLYYSASVAQKKHEKQSKFRAFERKMKPFVEAMDDYSAAVDVLANSSPTFVCPIWGSVRVLLKITHSFNKFFDDLLDTFDWIGRNLPRLRVYEQLFHGRPRLMLLLTDTYLDIIRFCIEAKNVFLRDKKTSVTLATLGRSLWKPSNRQFDGVLVEIKKHAEQADKEALVASMVDQKMKRQRKLLSQLSDVDYLTKHRGLQSLRQEGTGTWVKSETTFQDWLTCGESSCYSFFGIPGSGKTVLLSGIVDFLTFEYSNPGSAICYHYCDALDKRSLEPPKLFGSLTKQMLERLFRERKDVPKRIEDRIEKLFAQGSRQPTASDSKTLLLDVAREFGKLAVVLDGVDELGDQDQRTILDAIKEFACLQRPTTKVCISSRQEETTIRKTLKAFPSLEITIAKVSADIKVFITAAVESRIEHDELTLSDDLLKGEIIEALEKGAKDMFLWVKFQMDEICEAMTDHNIRRVLADLPKDLAETYSCILEKIAASTGGKFKLEIAGKIFKWIACARRPLTIDELKEAVAVEPGDKSLRTDRIPADEGKLLQACGNLVAFDRNTRTVTFAHYTIQQFLLSENLKEWHGCRMCFDLESADSFVGEVCVSYICFSDFDTQVLKPERPVVLDTRQIQGLYDELPYGSAIGKLTKRLYTTKMTSPVTLMPPVSKTQQQRSQKVSLNYRLLQYCCTYWPSHTARWEKSSSSKWHAFKHLVFDCQPLFPFRGWESCPVLRNNTEAWESWLPIVYLAIDQDHFALRSLFAEMTETNQVPSLGFYFRSPKGSQLPSPIAYACQSGRYAMVRWFCEFAYFNCFPKGESIDYFCSAAHADQVMLEISFEYAAKKIPDLETITEYIVPFIWQISPESFLNMLKTAFKYFQGFLDLDYEHEALSSSLVLREAILLHDESTNITEAIVRRGLTEKSMSALLREAVNMRKRAHVLAILDTCASVEDTLRSTGIIDKRRAFIFNWTTNNFESKIEGLSDQTAANLLLSLRGIAPRATAIEFACKLVPFIIMHGLSASSVVEFLIWVISLFRRQQLSDGSDVKIVLEGLALEFDKLLNSLVTLLKTHPTHINHSAERLVKAIVPLNPWRGLYLFVTDEMLHDFGKATNGQFFIQGNTNGQDVLTVASMQNEDCTHVIYQILKDHLQAIEHVDNFGRSAISYAAENKNKKNVEALMLFVSTDDEREKAFQKGGMETLTELYTSCGRDWTDPDPPKHNPLARIFSFLI